MEDGKIGFQKQSNSYITNTCRGRTGRSKNMGKNPFHCIAKLFQSALQKTMAKCYRHLWHTDKIAHQPNYQKVLMSSKGKRTWANLEKFNPGRCGVDEMAHIPSKKLQTVCIRFQITFGTPKTNVHVTLQYEGSSTYSLTDRWKTEKLTIFKNADTLTNTLK